MKELKALEILKFMKMSSSSNLTVLNEAIAELEASENRSCENCKNAYYQQFTSDLDDDVYSCDEFETNFINVNDSARPKDFYCNKWKQR